MTLRERGFLSRLAAHLLIPLLVLSPLPPSVQADLVALPLSLLVSTAEAQEVPAGVSAWSTRKGTRAVSSFRHRAVLQRGAFCEYHVLGRVAAYLWTPLVVVSPRSVRVGVVVLPVSVLVLPSARAREVVAGVPAWRTVHVAQDPLGNVTTFTRSEYVAEDGTTGIGPGGGTVRGEGGVELRVPEGALKKGATFKLSLVDPSELPTLFPNAQHETLAESLGAHHGSVLRLEASEGTRLEKEADLVFPLPDFTAVPEADRPTRPEDAFYYVHRRVERCADVSTTCPPESRIVVFEVIDEARAEGEGANARVVTASPPFIAVFGALAGAVLLFAMAWSYDAALVGRPKPGLVTGKVLRTKWGGSGTEFEPQAGVAVSATDQAGDSLAAVGGGTYAVTQRDGTFALWDNRYTGGTVEVVAQVEGNEVARGRAYEAVDPTLDRYQYKATVNLTLPAVEPPPAPPAVEIIVRDAASNHEIGGVAVAGSSLAISFRSTTSVLGASVNGSGYSVTTDGADQTLYRVAETVTAAEPGNFTIVAVAESGTGTIEVSRTVRVIAGGGRVDTLPGAAPVVTHVDPRDSAKGVAVSSFPQVFFSEPVRNIRDAATANLTLVEIDASGGDLEAVPVVLSGVDPNGLPVDQITTASQAVTSVTVQPLTGLKYSTRYRLKLGAGIVDLDPEPKPLTAHKSDFTTFGPVGVGGSEDQSGSAGIVVLGERSYLTRTNAFVNTNVLVFDIADPEKPLKLGESQVFAPVPYDIVGEDQGGEKLVAVALGSGSRSKPASVAFFDATTDDPRLVGVSTVADSAFDGFISRVALKGGLLFSATVRKGIQAIDVNQARQAWDALGGDAFKQQQALGKVNTDGQGFGQGAVVLTIPVVPKDNGTHYWLADIKAGDIQGQTLAVVTGEPGLLVASAATASMIYQGAPQAADGFKLVWGQTLALGRLSDQDIAVVVTKTDLAAVSLANPAQPQILGHVDLTQSLGGLAVTDVILSGDVALVGLQSQLRDEGAVVTVSLSDLAHPVITGRIEGVGGRLALGTGEQEGLVFSTARSPFAGSYPLGGVRVATLKLLALIKGVSATSLVADQGNLVTGQAVTVDFGLTPSTSIQSAQVEILRGDVVIETLAPKSVAGSSGQAIWPAKRPVVTGANYYARAVIVEGNRGETLRSAPRKIPVIERVVDLEIQGLREDSEPLPHELDPGATVIRNSDDDNKNRTPDFEELVPVTDENDLVPIKLAVATAALGPGTVTFEAVSGLDKVRVWVEKTKGTQVVLPKTWQAGDALPSQLYLEGITNSDAPRDIVLRLRYSPEQSPTQTYSDTVSVTVIEVDLDIDTDNDNGMNAPGRTPDEDKLEDVAGDPQKPGKYVVANLNDDDNDDIPDFADGYNRDAANADDDANASERFVPLVLELSKGIDITKARLKVTYSASVPSAVTTQGTVPEIQYTASTGHFRIWNREGATARNAASIVASPAGDFVPSGVVLEPAQLTLLGFNATKRDIKLYLEGIDASAAIADQRILVEVDPDGPGPVGFIATDAVRATAVKVELRDTADNNRQIIGGYVGWIAADPEPRMPQLRARVLPDLGSGISAEWSMRASYTDHGRNDIVLIPPAPQVQSQTPVSLLMSQEWDIAAAMTVLPQDERIFGGRTVIKLRVGSVLEYEHQFRIRGRNPSDPIARAFIDNHASPQDHWFAYAVAKHESKDGNEFYHQFYRLGSVYTKDENTGLPFFRPTPAGWGVMQMDFSGGPSGRPTVAEIWNWQANVLSGITKLNSSRAQATRWMRSLGPGRSGNRPIGQRPQSQIDAGGGQYVRDPNGDGRFDDATVIGGAPIRVPDEVVARCGFIDGTAREIEDAVTIKQYNSATRHYAYWDSTGGAWGFVRTNSSGFNYVARVCTEVEP